MKKVLVLVLVLGLVSVTNAVTPVVVSVQTDGSGSSAHTGLTSGSALADGETIKLKLMLSYNPSSSSSNIGYALLSFDLTLHADGISTIAVTPTKTVKFDSSLGGGTAVTDATGFSKITAVSLSGTTPAFGATGGLMIVSNMTLTAKSSLSGLINVDLGLRALSEYRNLINEFPGGNQDAWLSMVEGNLGDLQLYVAQIPEPMTLALLGLGGLFLRRRKA